MRNPLLVDKLIKRRKLLRKIAATTDKKMNIQNELEVHAEILAKNTDTKPVKVPPYHPPFVKPTFADLYWQITI